MNIEDQKIDNLNGLPSYHRPVAFDVSGAQVKVGDADVMNTEQLAQLEMAAKHLIPWRKGPFCLFGLEIDGEWCSDLKFDRFNAYLDQPAGKKILDIGCNNGYFMFRLLQHQPELVVGIDPVARCQQQFDLIQHFVQAPNLQFKSLGIQHLPQLSECFDIVLFMGIIYHHRHPLQQLLDIKTVLQPGGQVILETLGIPGDASYALFPEGRYAKMRNVWFVPTLSCCINWLQKTKFTDIEVLAVTALTEQEQRTTPWTNQQSLADFLDPIDPSKTIEGHPAPVRFCLSARG